MNSRETRTKPADEARQPQPREVSEPVSEIGDRDRELGRVAEALARR